MLTVWGRTTSSNVMKVMWAAQELGLRVERHDVGGAFGGNDTPDYLAMNPNGLVPTVRDGDLILWESNAILRYLGARYGKGGFYPEDARERALQDIWMDWQQTVLGPVFTPVFFGLVRTPEAERNKAAIASGIAASGLKLAMLDRALADRPFIGGASLGMGDIPIGPTVHRYFTLPLERPELANLRAWYDRMLERPGFRTHIADIPIS